MFKAFANDERILGGTGKRNAVETPYGSNVSVGEDFFANSGWVVLDTCLGTIGNNTMLGPIQPCICLRQRIGV